MIISDVTRSTFEEMGKVYLTWVKRLTFDIGIIKLFLKDLQGGIMSIVGGRFWLFNMN